MAKQIISWVDRVENSGATADGKLSAAQANEIKDVVNDNFTENYDAIAAIEAAISNVDNTADADKEVSGPQQAAIDTAFAGVASRLAPPVADIAALKALDTTSATDWPDKIMILAETIGQYRLDRESSAANDDDGVIQPTVGVGRWIKLNVIPAGSEIQANKGIANGYTPLGADIKIPAIYLPTIPSINVLEGIVGTLVNDTFATLSGSWTRYGATASISSVGGKLRMSAGDAGYVDYISSWATALENSELFCDISTVTDGGSVFLGFANDMSGSMSGLSYFVSIDTSSSGDRGKIMLETKSGNLIPLSTTGLTFTTGVGSIRLGIKRKRNGFEIYAQTGIQKIIGEIPFTINSEAGHTSPPKITRIAVGKRGAGTQDISLLNYSTTVKKRPKAVILGYSVSQGYNAGDLGLRYGSRMQTNSTDNIYVLSGAGADMSGQLLLIPELNAIAPEYVILETGLNNLYESIGTFQAKLDLLINGFIATSSLILLYCTPTANSVTNGGIDSTINVAIASRSDKAVVTIDTKTPLITTGNVLHPDFITGGDGTHPNALGHQVLANTIVLNTEQFITYIDRESVYDGVGARVIEVDQFGAPSATKEIINKKITDAGQIAALEGALFTTSIEILAFGYEGQDCTSATTGYTYYCIEDNEWVRVKNVATEVNLMADSSIATLLGAATWAGTPPTTIIAGGYEGQWCKFNISTTHYLGFCFADNNWYRTTLS